jgi:Acetyltransferase (GNAT) domain
MRVSSPAPREVWNELCEADGDVLVSQTPEWTDIVCALAGASDASRLYDFGDGSRLVLPLVRSARRPRSLATRASLPGAWGFGGLIGGPPRVEQVRAVLADLQAHASLRISVRPNPLAGPVWKAAAPPRMTRIARRAHVVDLRDGFEPVWRHFSKNARNSVRKAERLGVDVELDTAGRHASIFHSLYERSVERWARRQHEPLALARWRARRREPLEKFTELPRQLGDAGKLWVAWVDGRPAAAIFVLQAANAHYTRGAMDAELAGRSRANYLLHSIAIEDACRAGCNWYHLGESGFSPGLSQFKEALGGRAVEYAEYVPERFPVTRLDAGARALAKRAIGFRDDG